jgi:hypothetical protein
MKIQISQVNFSNFSAGLDIQSIDIQDYSVSNLPVVYAVCYYPMLKKLGIYKTTEEGAQNVYELNHKSIPTAIFYPLLISETENA